MLTINDIKEMLKGYRSLVQTMHQLEYELANHDQLVSNEEVIAMLTLPGAGDGGPQSTGKISDRTSSTALQYDDIASSIRTDFRAAVHRELILVAQQVKRMEFYVGLLSPDIYAVITLLYLEGHSAEETSHKLAVSLKTVNRRRNAGIAILNEMYNRLAGTLID
jgi:DNA-directed RNA polymerase specialized sigma subunit, sigma24 homolog